MILLDVRTEDEWVEGHLKGAMHLDLQQIMEGAVPHVDTGTEIGVYCRSGARAGMAVQLLERAGFTTVKNIGGLEDAQVYGDIVRGNDT